MAEVSDILEELDELHGRLMAVIVEFPTIAELEVEGVTFLEAVRDIANMKDQTTPHNIKLGIEAVQFIKTLFGKMLRDQRCDNTWKHIKPCYILADYLLYEDD